MADPNLDLGIKHRALESVLGNFIECGVTVDRMAMIESYTLSASAFNSIIFIDGVPRYTVRMHYTVDGHRHLGEIWHV